MSAREHSGWIGVDLDGTLAQYDGFKGPFHIGPPIPKMVARVKEWLANGITVKIVTARVSPGALKLNTTHSIWETDIFMAVKKWRQEHIGVELPVTCEKDYQMWQLWDDRCVQVIPNTGERADGKP